MFIFLWKECSSFFVSLFLFFVSTSATADLEVFVRHASTSTGTAYNVTVNVYLPDYMTMKKYVFTTPLQNTIVVRQNGTVIVTEVITCVLYVYIF